MTTNIIYIAYIAMVVGLSGCGSVSHSRTFTTACGESRSSSVRVAWGPEISVYVGGNSYDTYGQYGDYGPAYGSSVHPNGNPYIPVYAPPSVTHYYDVEVEVEVSHSHGSQTPQKYGLQP